MLERAFGAGVRPRGVAGGRFYGKYEQFWKWLEGRGRSYALAVSPSHQLWQRINGAPRWESAEKSPELSEAGSWERVETDTNDKWLQDREWVRHRLAYYAPPGWERWLLTGRSVAQPDEYTHYRTYNPEGIPLAELVRRVGIALAVENGIEQAKYEVGVDQYEVRGWEAWHRHVTLCLLAHAALQVTRADR